MSEGSVGADIRVLWVSPTISKAFGGPTRTLVNGLLAETRAGLESSLITTTFDRDEANVGLAKSRLDAGGVGVLMFPRTTLLAKAEAWGFSPKMVIWMVRNLRTFDVIHLQYVWCMSSIVGAVLARRYDIPLVITPHESLTDYDIDVASRSRAKRRLKLLLRRLYLRTADCLVFMSDLERRDTQSGSTPSEVISHAVHEEVVPQEPPRPTPQAGPLRIAFVGRSDRKKRVELIIEALGRNHDRNWRLFIAGPPGTEEFMNKTQQLVHELGVEDKIEWLGFLDRPEDLMENCDVLTMPSAYEAFGMVAAEALCIGLPVIVPRQSGVASIVSEFDAGIVMDESSVDELSQALIAMEDDPNQRLRFAQNGLRAANSRLTFEAYASSTADLYASLLSG